MSYALISMLYRHNIEKLKGLYPGSGEYNTVFKNVMEYDTMLKEIDKQMFMMHRPGGNYK